MRLTDSLSDQDSAVVRKTTATPTGRRTSTFEIMSANPIVMPLQVAMNLLALRTCVYATFKTGFRLGS